MRRILGPYLTSLLPLAIVGGLIVGPSDATAAVKAVSKSKKSTPTLTRAQNAEEKVVLTNSTLVDEEIFDRELSPAAQIAGAEMPTAPNCTNVFGPNSGLQGSPYGQPPASPQPLPDASSPLSNPDSVFSPSQQQPSQMPAPVTSLAAGQGASTSMSYVPSFMGDFFGGAGTSMYDTTGGSSGFLAAQGSVAIPTSSTVGIMKLAENTSPLPRDRVFLSYNYFSNVNLVPGGIPVNRFTPGIEKTFFGGNTSVEVRVPMALTLNSNTTLGQPYDTNQYELGNLTTYFKALLYRDEQFAFSTGLGIAAPTANSTKIYQFQGRGNSANQLVTVGQINNQSWHLMPFIGSVYTPNDRWYAQSMVQLDFAANGNSVYTQNFSGVLQKDGALNDPTYLFSSVGAGYWMYQSADPSARLSRVSLISELHLNTSLQATDVVRGTEVNTGTRQSQIQTTNAVFGSNIMLGQDKSLLLGYVVPIGGGADKAFTGEFRVLFNWYFGASQNRATRVQF